MSQLDGENTMNHEELLARLAMELAEWPLDSGQARRAMPDDTDTRVAAQDIYNAIRDGKVPGVGLTR